MKNTLLHQDVWTRLDNSPMRSETHKAPGGIIQRMFLRDKIIQETFSPRPYKLGQACDGTIGICAMALYLHFCMTHGFDAEGLLQRAYPEEYITLTIEAQQDIIDCAALEGISVPLLWDENAFAGLLQSLEEINYHQLYAVLEEVYPL